MENNPAPMLVVGRHKPHPAATKPALRARKSRCPSPEGEGLGRGRDRSGSAGRAPAPGAPAETAWDASGPAIVILLYTVTRWEGVPASTEGGQVGWFSPAEIAKLDRPPLDISLTERLFPGIATNLQ